jgi:anti-sigma factor RsiW
MWFQGGIDMCPDRQLLSVYLDGELPSPWKEKMESHLASCSLCQGAVESWKRISGEMRIEEDPRSRERVWERIRLRIEDAEESKITGGEEAFRVFSGAGRPRDSRASESLWRRRVSLPFPAIAVMGAAAAAMVLVLGSILLKPSVQVPLIPNAAISSLETAGIDMELNSIRPVSDVSGVLHYLESMDSDDIVIIRLPESRSFQSAGEPKMLRAADYSSRRSGQ